ncbi:uncharacterized protein Z518_05312 [Rhinocladiella mackenziei CBS 650.93]|uniref:PNPLA domain-containing protein n=1 Tax=Rhinocladiella mackenziei CBS 650.93 TaxID=1442369 RepID=A0A0D2IF55_9EURO|nr:uncharacterized protein Z518_05312 [Rhinocladiella mackenziei CBS 650.93]KIX04444.1 hypothetical protein Z518_05312 [Rhinocladiella mackenziei CBS 650.93]
MTEVVNLETQNDPHPPKSALRRPDSSPPKPHVQVGFVEPRTDSTVEPEASTQSETSDLLTTSPLWSRKLILTLDGGGIRVYSSLVILRALMKEIENIEKNLKPEALSSAATDRISRKDIPDHVFGEGKYLPCHYFDYIGGTSTGGLIAIMLGMLGMSVDECIDKFEKNQSVPQTKEDSLLWDFFKIHKFSFNSPSASLLVPPNSGKFKKDAFQCQTLALCTVMDNQEDKPKPKPYAFCSYEDYSTLHAPPSIEEVAEAITARRSSKPRLGQYFDGSKQPELRDPTVEVMKEVHELFSLHDPSIELILSFGWDDDHSPQHFVERLRRSRNRTLEPSNEMKHTYKMYHRFDIHLGIFKKHIFRKMETATTKWLEEPKHMEEIRTYANILVERRRGRARTPRWESFALGVRYFCPHEECSLKGHALESRDDYFDHLNTEHALMKNIMKSKLEKSRPVRKVRSLKSMGRGGNSAEMKSREPPTSAGPVDLEVELDRGRKFQ